MPRPAIVIKPKSMMLDESKRSFLFDNNCQTDISNSNKRNFNLPPPDLVDCENSPNHDEDSDAAAYNAIKHRVEDAERPDVNCAVLRGKCLTSSLLKEVDASGNQCSCQIPSAEELHESALLHFVVQRKNKLLVLFLDLFFGKSSIAELPETCLCCLGLELRSNQQGDSGTKKMDTAMMDRTM